MITLECNKCDMKTTLHDIWPENFVCINTGGQSQEFIDTEANAVWQQHLCKGCYTDLKDQIRELVKDYMDHGPAEESPDADVVAKCEFCPGTVKMHEVRCINHPDQRQQWRRSC